MLLNIKELFCIYRDIAGSASQYDAVCGEDRELLDKFEQPGSVVWFDFWHLLRRKTIECIVKGVNDYNKLFNLPFSPQILAEPQNLAHAELFTFCLSLPFPVVKVSMSGEFVSLQFFRFNGKTNVLNLT